jgi:plastocyanin
MKDSDPAISRDNHTRNSRVRRSGTIATLISLCFALPAALAEDFTVTTPGGQFAFNFNGVNSPKLTLVRGHTYTFQVNTTPGIHPFRVHSPGVVNNNISSGTLTYTVPASGTNFTYDCTVHGASMRGTIVTIDPPPSTVRILSISVGTNIVLRSTGATNLTVMPEYTTNLSSTNWFALTVQTNRFADGTNDTICGLPQGARDAVFIRIKSRQD